MPCISAALFLAGGALQIWAEEPAIMAFNLPDGLIRTQTVVRKINTWTKETINSPRIDEDKTVSLVTIRHTPTETRIEHAQTAHSRTVNGTLFSNPSQQVLIGKTNTFVVSSNGDLLRVEQDDHFLDDVKAAFPADAHAGLETALGGQNGFFMEKRLWNMSVQRYVGKPVKKGTRWRETVAISAQADAVPFRAYTVTVVLKQVEEGGKRLVTTLSLESTNPEDLQLVHTNGLSSEVLKEFLMQFPARPFASKRIARWRTVEISTMLPIREERQTRWLESRPEGSTEVSEHRIETYDDARRE